MGSTTFINNLEFNPVIAGIKDEEALKQALKSDCAAVFILKSTLMNVTDYVDRIKAAGKKAFVHVDLMEGASSKETVLEYLQKMTQADGIISTKAQMVKLARKYGFITIHRFFLMDSMSYHNIDKQIAHSEPDFIEICPGGMTKTIGWVKEKVDTPILASGLVCDKEDVVAALSKGALGVSSTNTEVWEL
ncbi:glycerol uptake operon antiterminator [Salsuginibacillus halophilus]|uniref:Glycerol uptake operon antiterminator regulatory protein n=1 Tax=Salsuginibacillus halophilus TaxID=517424 RepID=A0A2P8HL56_9BACI|nr:glycerol-3-phosphate responsive antiterminator [Salsuginibacillus halophilus]PSL46952.1 glycerol uptake operon antiterminator [Salsuginibacillus halophilus]